MSYQMPLSPEEQQVLESELDILFACQAKTLNKEMRGIWVNEINKAPIPINAILQGLKSLKAEDIQSIKLNIVFSAARKFMEPDELDDCEDCASGYVVMKDEEKRSFVLRCRCAAGHSKLSQGLAQWNGEPTQFSKGRMLIRQGFGLY